MTLIDDVLLSKDISYKSQITSEYICILYIYGIRLKSNFAGIFVVTPFVKQVRRCERNNEVNFHEASHKLLV